MQKQNQANYHKAGRTREITIKGQRIKINVFINVVRLCVLLFSSLSMMFLFM
jgi:hypothetical protein